MRKITPCLWFSGNAEDAVAFYLSVFRNSRKLQVTHYGEDSRLPKGSVLNITFQPEGQDDIALNGDMEFKFNESLSLMVGCDTQQEIDALWEKLTADGGEPGQCGWLKNRYGILQNEPTTTMPPPESPAHALAIGDPRRAPTASQTSPPTTAAPPPPSIDRPMACLVLPLVLSRWRAGPAGSRSRFP